MAWKPTPPELKFTARRLVGDGWSECGFEDLRPGDVVQFRTPDGEVICPATHEPNEIVVSQILSVPMKMDEAEGHPRSWGLGIEIVMFRSLDEFRQKGAN